MGSMGSLAACSRNLLRDGLANTGAMAEGHQLAAKRLDGSLCGPALNQATALGDLWHTQAVGLDQRCEGWMQIEAGHTSEAVNKGGCKHSSNLTDACWKTRASTWKSACSSA